MRTVSMCSLLPVLILCVGAEWSNGQREPGSAAGAVKGIVVDTDGRPVAGVRVYPMQTGPTPVSVTDVQGRFELVGVPAGSVRIFTESGFGHTDTEIAITMGRTRHSIGALLTRPMGRLAKPRRATRHVTNWLTTCSLI
jgi:hypothetical protein